MYGRGKVKIVMRRDEKEQPLEGKYSNYFNVGHNAFEFIIDCGQYYPENGDVLCHTRIITSPAYASALFQAMKAALETYSEDYGEISFYGEDSDLVC